MSQIYPTVILFVAQTLDGVMTVFCSFLNAFGNTNKNYLTLNLFGAATMTTKENTKT